MEKHGVKHFCTICERAFPTPSKLKIHQRVHTEEKPYACSICGKAFAYASNLNKHALIHAEKQYACLHCSKMFTTKQHLQRHQAMHLRKDELTACELCNQILDSKDDLQRHVSLIHPAASSSDEVADCPQCRYNCNCFIADVGCGCHFIHQK